MSNDHGAPVSAQIVHEQFAASASARLEGPAEPLRLTCPSCGGNALICRGCGQAADWLGQLGPGRAVVLDGRGGADLATFPPPVLEVGNRRLVLSDAAVELLEVLAAAGISPADALERVRGQP